MTERDIFLDALEHGDPAARAAYLDVVCAGRPALRCRVEELLRIHREDDTFLNVPVMEQLAAAEESLAFLGPAAEPGALGRLDHYEVLEVVGRGSTGVVLKARDTKLQRVVAIKALVPRLAASVAARLRFVREAQAAAAVRDDNVVAIYAVSEHGPVPYLVMEYICGLTLEQRVRPGQALDLKEILRIGMQLAAGLAAAHAQGLVHRDIKPANILLENGVQRVKITDFGLARVAADASPTEVGTLAGTPQYMSPEQARGEPTDHRTDLFSLGSVLYTLCAGRPPFRADTTAGVLCRIRSDASQPVREINPDVPEWLCGLIGKLHAKEAPARPGSAREVADLLGSRLALLQQPPLTPPPSAEPVAAGRAAQAGPRTQGLPPSRRLTAAIGVVGLLAALAVLAFLLTWWQRNGWKLGQGGEIPRGVGGPVEPLELRREAIPPALLALAGGGDPTQAPPELAAVLGDGQFLLPGGGVAHRESDWMAVSADGTTLAVPCSPWVCLFDVRTGALLRSLSGFRSRAYRVAFSPDGKRLAATPAYDEGEEFGNTIKVWEVESGHELLTLRGHKAKPTAVAFSPDGKRLATGSWDLTAKVWDADTGQEVRTLAGHTGPVDAIAFGPDGRQLATGSFDLTVKVWDLDAGQETHSLSGHTQKIASLAFSPGGKLLAGGSGSGIKLWATDTFQEAGTFPENAAWMAFTADGTKLLAAKSAYADGEVHTVTPWDLATGKPLEALRLAGRGGQGIYCLTPDGNTLFAMRKTPMDPFVRLYDAATGKELLQRRGHVAPLNTVAVSPDGRTLASAGEDRAVKLWDLSTGQVLHSMTAHTGAVSGLAFSPDGQLLASGSRDGTIAFWDVGSGSEVRSLHGHSHAPSHLRFSPDGRTLAAGSEGGLVKTWEVATGTEGRSLPGHTGVVRCVAFSPDGRLLASGGEDRSVRLHDLVDGGVRKFSMPAAVNQVAFSPDGLTVAAVGDASNPAVQVWNLGTGERTTWPGHVGNVHGLAFSPSAPLLATSGDDGTVRLWDRSGGAPRVRTIGPGPFGGAARAVAFTPDGRYLTTANANGMVYLLRVGPTSP